jgi:hypothetical protein
MSRRGRFALPFASPGLNAAVGALPPPGRAAADALVPVDPDDGEDADALVPVDPDDGPTKRARGAPSAVSDEAELLPPPPPGTSDDKIRGNKNRDRVAGILFRALARGDFHHDFGENEIARDKITPGDENRFFEIAKLISKKGSVFLRSKFKEYHGKNLYTIIADGINTILPPLPPPPPRAGGAVFGDLPAASEDTIETYGVEDPITESGAFASEDQLLRFVGLDWVALKKEVTRVDPGVEIPAKFNNIVTGTRDYKIRACPYRKSLIRTDRDYKTNRAPIEILKTVTGGKTKFACIIDASGGLPFSDLRNMELIGAADESGSTVYIIENIENGADSATKILPPPILPGRADPATKARAPALRILRDKETTVNYPLWSSAVSDQKSNIYSNIFIVLNRTSETTIEANLQIKDAAGKTIESFSIGDVSTVSNVKNATLYALAVFLEKGIANETLIYALLKRMGDWCQALSLLDLDRAYNIYEADGKTSVGRGTTLRELIKQDTEVGIVTNDRILLAFCILLGLNVFYTSAMDIARLIYFKNALDTPSPEALRENVENTIRKIDDLYGALMLYDEHTREIEAFRTTFIRDKLNAVSVGIPEYIFNLRNLLSNLSRLRLDIGALAERAQASNEIARDTTKELPERLSAANATVSLLVKIEGDIAYNESVLTDIGAGIYPGSSEKASFSEKIRLAALAKRLSSGGRATTSVEVTEAKNILLETRGDIGTLLKKPGNLLAGVFPLRTVASFGAAPDSKTAGNYAEILSVAPAIEILLPTFVLAPVVAAPVAAASSVPVPGPNRKRKMGGGQHGGGPVEDAVNRAWAALTTRKIRVLPPASSALSFSSSTPVEEVTSTVNIYRVGSMYVDASLKGYTVVNEYIITEDDLPVFDKVFSIGTDRLSAITDATAMQALVNLCNRYILLRLDMAMNDLDQLVEDMLPSYEALLTPDALTKRLEKEQIEMSDASRTIENVKADVIQELIDEAIARQRVGTPGYARRKFLEAVAGITTPTAATSATSPVRTAYALYSYIPGYEEEEAAVLEEEEDGAAASESSAPLISAAEAAATRPPTIEDIRVAAIGELETVWEGLKKSKDTLYIAISSETPPASVEAERTETVAREQQLSRIVQDAGIVEPIVQKMLPDLGITYQIDPKRYSPLDAKFIVGIGAAIRNAILTTFLEQGDPEQTRITTKDIVNFHPETAMATAIGGAVENYITKNKPAKAGKIETIKTGISRYFIGIRSDLLGVRGGSLEGGDGTESNAGLSSSGGVLPGGRRRLYEGLRKRSG